MINLTLPLHEFAELDELVDTLQEEFTLEIEYKYTPPLKGEECCEVEFLDDPQDLVEHVMRNVAIPTSLYIYKSDDVFKFQVNLHNYIEAWMDGTGIDAVMDLERDRAYE